MHMEEPSGAKHALWSCLLLPSKHSRIPVLREVGCLSSWCPGKSRQDLWSSSKLEDDWWSCLLLLPWKHSRIPVLREVGCLANWECRTGCPLDSSPASSVCLPSSKCLLDQHVKAATVGALAKVGSTNGLLRGGLKMTKGDVYFYLSSNR